MNEWWEESMQFIPCGDESILQKHLPGKRQKTSVKVPPLSMLKLKEEADMVACVLWFKWWVCYM